jgi:ketosteroid isomerase-like protein
MSRQTLALALALGLGLALAPAGARAGDKEDDVKAIAVKVTTAGAALFDARDAKGLAMTYTDDALLDVFRKDETGSLKVETKVGRAEIQGYYESLFKSMETIHAKNTIEYARRLDADVITFSGVFEPNAESAEGLKLPFIQVRTREGDAWKVVSLQLFIVPRK